MHKQYSISRLGKALLYSGLARSISRRSRAEKVRRFQRLLGETAAVKMLDIGAGTEWEVPRILFMAISQRGDCV